MKTHIGCVVLFLALAGAGRAEDRPHNAYWWADFSRERNLVFVQGYVEAMTHAHGIAQWACLADRNGGKLPEKYLGREAIEACSQSPTVTVYDFTDIPFGQLVDGVDEFYKDFRNKDVEINLGLRYVRDQLKGKSAKELEDELTLWRRGSSQ